jgi:WD40 repeat protein
VHVRSLADESGFDLPQPPTKVLSLVFCGPKYLATGGSDNVIRLWDLSSRTQVGQLSDHEGSVVALASDGEVLVSGGYDTTIRIWDLKGRVAWLPRRTQERK